MAVIRHPFEKMIFNEMKKDDIADLFSDDSENDADIIDQLMETSSFTEDIDLLFPPENKFVINEL
jgi:hypothetical protein